MGHPVEDVPEVATLPDWENDPKRHSSAWMPDISSSPASAKGHSSFDSETFDLVGGSPVDHFEDAMSKLAASSAENGNAKATPLPPTPTAENTQVGAPRTPDIVGVGAPRAPDIVGVPPSSCLAPSKPRTAGASPTLDGLPGDSQDTLASGYGDHDPTGDSLPQTDSQMALDAELAALG